MTSSNFQTSTSYFEEEPEEIVLHCLALIISILCDSYIWKREKDFWFSLQENRPQTGQSLTDLEKGTKIHFFHFQESLVQVSADAMS